MITYAAEVVSDVLTDRGLDAEVEVKVDNKLCTVVLPYANVRNPPQAFYFANLKKGDQVIVSHKEGRSTDYIIGVIPPQHHRVSRWELL